MERSAVVEYLIHDKLSKRSVAEEILQRMMTDKVDDPLRRKITPWIHVSALVRDLTQFAVLSHAWGLDEPCHDEFFAKVDASNSRGYKKLREFCRIAHDQYGVEFAWTDTVCINKSSSSELDESIRSMFTWYHESLICIVYLGGTEAPLDFPFDRWFTRGWTLQELLAPKHIKFYNKHWEPLTDLCNDKTSYQSLHALTDGPDPLSPDDKHLLQLRLIFEGISAATGIPEGYISNLEPGLQNPSFPERMRWIARRVTARPEDISYSTLGILGISIPVAYGEGAQRAFFGLFQAALEADWEPSWFLWDGKAVSPHIHPSKMVPSSPACYLSWNPGYNILRSSNKEIMFWTRVFV